MQMNAVIVDDEPFIRDDLRYMLKAHPEIEVVGEAGDVGRARALLVECDPDVVFLDIQLRGGSGMELLPFIRPSTRIVFLTAHSEYAVRAFEINALDYILKPLSGDRLAVTIERLKAENERRTSHTETETPLRPEDQIFIKTDSEQAFVIVATIRAITSIGGNYTALFLASGEKYIVRKTFKEWEKLLPESVFLRIHRSTIVNRIQIERIQRGTSGTWRIHLFGHPDSFTVSRRMVSVLKDVLEAGNGSL